jgi:hypothetical protein
MTIVKVIFDIDTSTPQLFVVKVCMMVIVGAFLKSRRYKRRRIFTKFSFAPKSAHKMRVKSNILKSTILDYCPVGASASWTFIFPTFPTPFDRLRCWCSSVGSCGITISEIGYIYLLQTTIGSSTSISSSVF